MNEEILENLIEHLVLKPGLKEIEYAETLKVDGASTIMLRGQVEVAMGTTLPINIFVLKSRLEALHSLVEFTETVGM